MAVSQGPGSDLSVVKVANGGSNSLREVAGSVGWPQGDKVRVHPPPPSVLFCAVCPGFFSNCPQVTCPEPLVTRSRPCPRQNGKPLFVQRTRGPFCPSLSMPRLHGCM